MAIFRQLGKLFWKNYILRKRKPFLLALEILWPIAIVAIVVLVRFGTDPTVHKTCGYHERAMPSAGMIPFLQSMTCNIDNRCDKWDDVYERQSAQAQLSKFFSKIQPYLVDPDTLVGLDGMKESTEVIELLMELIDKNKVPTSIVADEAFKVKSLFKNPDKVLEALGVVMSPEAANALLEASLELTNLLDLTGYVNLKKIVCNITKLNDYLIFQLDANGTAVSAELCDINTELIPNITDFVLGQLNMSAIIRISKRFAIIMGDYEMGHALEDIAMLIDLMFEMSMTTPLLEYLPELKLIPDLLQKIPQWLSLFEKVQSVDTEAIGQIMIFVDSIIGQVSPNDDTWNSIKSSFQQGKEFVDYFKTRKDMPLNLTELLNKGKELMGKLPANDTTLAILAHFGEIPFDMLSEMNIDNIMQMSMTSVMDNLQLLLESVMGKSEVQKTLAFYDKNADMLTELLLFNRKFNAKLQNLKYEPALVERYNSLLVLDSSTIFMVLQHFTDPETIVNFLNSNQEFKLFCKQTLNLMTPRPSASSLMIVINNVCSTEVSNLVDTFIEDLEVDQLDTYVRMTINEMDNIYSGVFVEVQDVKFSVIFTKYERIMEILLEQTLMANMWDIFFKSMTPLDSPLFDDPGWIALKTSSTKTSLTVMAGMWGPLLEKKNMWSMIGPSVRTLELLVKNIAKQSMYSTEMMNTDTDMGMLIWYLVEYSPEIVKASWNLQQMNKLWNNQDPVYLICQNNFLEKLGMSSSVPVAEIKTLFCKIDWEKVQMDLWATFDTMSVITKVENLFNESLAVGTELGYDWINYAETVYGGFSEIIISQSSMMMMESQRLRYNWTKLAVAFSSMSEKMNPLSLFDLDGSFDGMVTMLNGLEQSLGNSTYWRMTKLYIGTQNAYFKFMNKYLNQALDEPKSLNYFYNISQTVGEFYRKTAEIAPDFIDALSNTLLHQEKLVGLFMNSSISENCSESGFLENFLVLDASSPIHDYEKFLCGINWEDVAIEMAQNDDAFREYLKYLMMIGNLEGGLLPDIPDVDVNWQEFFDNIVQYSYYLENMMATKTILLPEFDMYRVNASFNNFMAILELSGQLEMEIIPKFVDELQAFSNFMTVVEEGPIECYYDNSTNSTNFSNSTTVCMSSSTTVFLPLLGLSPAVNYLSYHFMKFGTTQLDYFNRSSSIDLLQYFNSTEINKMITVIEKAPERNEIVLQTLLMVILQQGELLLNLGSLNMSEICTNPKEFQKLLLLYRDAPIDSGRIKEMFCALTPNITKLKQELEHSLDGFGDLLMAIDVVSSGRFDPETMGVNFSTVMRENQLYGQLLTDVLVNLPEMTIMWPTTDFWNTSIYEHQWQTFVNQLMSSMSSDSLYNSMSKFQEDQLFMMVGAMASYPETNYILQMIHISIKQNIEEYELFNRMMSNPEDPFKDFPNLQKIWNVMDSLPELFQAWVFTSITEPEKTSKLTDRMIKGMTHFCDWSTSSLLTPMPGTNFNFSAILLSICSANTTLLLEELDRFQGNDLPFQVAEVTNSTDGRNTTFPELPTVNITELLVDIEKLNRIMEKRWNMSYESQLVLPRFLNLTVWADIVSMDLMLESDYLSEMTTAAVYNLLVRLSETYPNFFTIMKYSEVSYAVMGMFVDIFENPGNNTYFKLEDFFPSSPQIQKLLTILQNPGVMEVLFSSLNTPNFGTLFVAKNITEFVSFICQPSSDLNNYFTVPPKSIFNMTILKEELCSLDWSVMMQEFAAEFPVDSVMKRMNSTTVDVGLIFTVENQILELVEMWSMSVTELNVPVLWNNESFWTNIFNEALNGAENYTFNPSHIWQTLNAMQVNEENQNLFKTVHTFNLIIEVISDRLLYMQGNVSLSNLFRNSTDVVNMLEAYAKINNEGTDALINEQISFNALLTVIDSPELFAALCANQSLAKFLSINSTVHSVASDMERVMCVYPRPFFEAMMDQVQSDRLTMELTNLWNSTILVSAPDFRLLERNINKFSERLHWLVMTPPRMEPTIGSILDFNTSLLTLTRLFADPMVMLRLSGGYDSLIEKYLNDSMMPIIQTLNMMADPLLRFMQNSLDANPEMDWATLLMTDPENTRKLLEALTSIDAQLGLIANSFTKPYLEGYGELPDIQSMVCNATSLSVGPAMKRTASDIRDILCGLEPARWYDELINNGFPASDIQLLLKKFQLYMIDHNIPESFQPFPTVTWSELLTKVESLANTMVGPRNVSEEIDWLGFLEELQMYVDNYTTSSTFDLLKLLDSQSSNGTSYLLGSLNGYVNFLATLNEYMSDQIRILEGLGDNVPLISILPNSTALSELIARKYGDLTAAGFLVAMVNPLKVMELSGSSEWEKTVCDPIAFASIFYFPPDIHVAQIQQDLCSDAQQQESDIQNALSTLGMGEVLTALNNWMMGENVENGLNTTSVWDRMKKQTEQFNARIQQIAGFNLTLDGLEQWMQPLIAVAASSSNPSIDSFDKMCNNMVLYLNNSNLYENMLQPVLSDILMNLEATKNQIQLQQELDAIICDMSSLNLTALMIKLTKSDINNTIAKIVNPMYQRFECSRMFSIVNEINEVMNQIVGRMMMNEDKMLQCLKESVWLTMVPYQDISNTFAVSGQLLQVLNDPSLQELVNNEGLLKILDYLLQGYMEQEKVTFQMMDLMNNMSMESYLQTSLQLTPDVLDALLKSSISLDSAVFVGKSVEEIVQMLCDPTKLDEIITMPEFANVSPANLSALFCGSSVMQIAQLMKTSAEVGSISSDLMSHKAEDLQVWYRLSKHLNDLAENIEDLAKLQQLMNIANYDKETLKKFLPKLQLFLINFGPDPFVNSINAVLEDLKAMDNRTFITGIISDLQIFSRGLMGLNIIKKFIPISIILSDVVKSPKEFKMYLMYNHSLSSDIADAILGSSIQYTVLLAAMDQGVEDIVCDENRLEQLFILNSTSDVDIAEISDAICEQNSTVLAELAESLMAELDIGVLIKQYVLTSGESLLKNVNLTEAVAKEKMSYLVKAQNGMKGIFESFKQNEGEIVGLDSLFNLPQAQTGAEMLQSMTPLICGSFKKKTFSDSFRLGNYFSGVGKLTREQEKQLKDVPIGFCRDMFREIHKSPSGPVILAYLKPILIGKILYTPDNPETRRIIEEANATFATFDEIQDYAQTWSSGATDIQDLMKGLDGMTKYVDILNNSFVSGLLFDAIGVSGKEIVINFLSVDEKTKAQLDSIVKVGQLIANFSSCVEADRFLAVGSEKELEMEAARLQKKQLLLAGVVFMKSNGKSSDRKKRDTISTSGIAKHIVYKIRMDIDNVPFTNIIKERMWSPLPHDDFGLHLRYLRGFSQLQDILDTAIIKLQTGSELDGLGTYLQQFPFPCHKRDLYLHVLNAYLLPILMTFALLAALGVATYNLVHDRENGQEETLQIMGLRSKLNGLAWLLSTMILMAITSIFCVAILKYGELFQYSNFWIVFLFFIDFCFSTLMLCYMVSAFFTRTTLAILTVLIVYMISYLPYIVMVSLEVDMVFWQKTLASLSCTTAFAYGAQYLARYEMQLVGLQWHNIRESPMNGDHTDFHWICIMMLIDAAIYFIVGWYIRNIKPGKYGISKPWYFPFCPTYWGCHRSTTADKYCVRSVEENDENVLQENVKSGQKVGISVNGLTKYFQKQKVVDNVNTELYEGQVTALLGHNGAAKTTTINMLIGILEPSSGHVFIYGKPVHQSSHMIGVCPQHNALYPYMTVREHMEFHSAIKSDSSSKKRMEEIIQLLRDVDLWYVRDVLVKNLSGGMKRKLCVALAFVGGSQAVILDEPSSGVDPNGRQSIWNLISNRKQGCTVLLSTHHLDEADLIGDRVAIMHNGRMLCLGTSMFLKEKLGSGYTLTIIKEIDEQKACDPSKVLALLKSKIPSAQLLENIGSELTFLLPVDDNSKELMYQLLLDLDRYKDDLHIASYGVSDTSLEEVFLKVCEVADCGKQLTSESLQEQRMKQKTVVEKTESLSSEESNTNETAVTIKDGKQDRSIGSCGKFWAMIVKRFHHYRRDWRMLISVILLPCIFFAISMGFTTIKPDETDIPAIVLTPAMYGPNTYDFIQDKMKTGLTQKMMQSMVDGPGIGTTCMSDFPSQFKKQKYQCMEPEVTFTQPAYKPNNDAKCSCDDYHYVCDAGAGGRPPPQLITPTTDILQDLRGYNTTQYLIDNVMNFIDKRYGGWSLEPGADSLSMKGKIWFNNQGYHSMVAFYNAYSNALLRASVTDPEVEEYGITVINHPLYLNTGQLNEATMLQKAGDLGLSFCILFAFSFIPAGLVLFAVDENVRKEKHLQFVQGIQPWLYWLATYIWDLIFFSVTVGLCVIIIAIFQLPTYWEKMNLPAVIVLLLLYGWATLPWMYIMSKLFRDGASSYIVLFCLNNFLGICLGVLIFVLHYFSSEQNIGNAYEVCRYLFLLFPPYCLGEGLIELASNQLRSSILIRFQQDVYMNPFSFDMIAWNYIALAIEGLVFFIILLLTECKCSCSSRHAPRPSGDDLEKEDEEVKNERHRVQTGFAEDDVVLVNNMSKVYKRGRREFLAVDHVNFGVTRGECFGLLGINGAGKTTTFRMLTGDCQPSDGNAILSNKRIGGGRVCLGQEVGYCPQEDALDNFLTGGELLHYYAKLRGLSSTARNQHIDNIIRSLSLSSFVNKKINTCSGGMKRRLSLAIALLGEPQVILLDEPTSGMDPATKRLTWNCILSAVRNGQVVILTSHSMDECDALCTKLSIMVNGQMRCFGSPQLLKNKYGGGYTVKLYFYGLSKSRLVMEFIHSYFPGAEIKEHLNVIELNIPRESTNVANIFGILEREKNNYNIQYYSVSQTTLNTVFLNFAQEQTDGVTPALYDDSEKESSGSERDESPRNGTSTAFSNETYGFHNKGFSHIGDDLHFKLAKMENELPEKQEHRYVSSVYVTKL